MSKLARKPIPVPEGVTITQEKDLLQFKGKKGAHAVPLLKYITAEISPNEIRLTAKETHAQARSNWGTMASLVKSAITGVQDGFEKRLEIEGIGFKANMKDKTLVLSLGFTHDVNFVPPPGVSVTTEKNVIIVSGIDKALVGEAAAQIRKQKKPEPYKGKGIHYVGEVIRRKAGKKVAGAGADKK